MNVRYISLNFHVHDTNLNEYRYSVQVTHCLLIFPCTRITYYTKQINADWCFVINVNRKKPTGSFICQVPSALRLNTSGTKLLPAGEVKALSNNECVIGIITHSKALRYNLAAFASGFVICTSNRCPQVWTASL